MSNENLETVSSMALTSEVQIRAYIHPTRMTILAILAGEKQTVTNVARQMGVHPANITHHFRLLEKAGLILLVEKRETGRNLEKYYRAAAYHFTVELADDKPVNKQVLALTILRDHLTTAIQALKAEPPQAKPEEKGAGEKTAVLGMLTAARLNPADVAYFVTRLGELSEEFRARDAESGQVYHLNTSLYPGEVGDTGGGDPQIHTIS